MNKQGKQTKTHRHREQYGGYQMEMGWEGSKEKRAKGHM